MADGDKFPISTEVLNDPDFWVVFLEATEKTQTPFLRRAVRSDYLEDRMQDEDELKRLLCSMILAATTRDDRNVDKGVVLNLLSELNNCLGGNESVTALLSDYRDNLQWHSQAGRFYYQQGADRIFSNEDRFRPSVVENKTDLLRIDIGSLGPIEEIRLRVVIKYYDEIIKGFSNKEHLAPLVKRLDKRVDDLKRVVTITDAAVPTDRNLTILSLRDVNIHMRKILPLLLCKRLYDQKKSENDDTNYVNLIVDEAHNILSEESERESEQWKDYRLETFEEIVKEGRKFGVFVTIASQRPADISPTIISQLHNYFLHRLINNEDIRAVEKTISYLDKVSFEYLPILPTGTCIFAGLLANVPVVVDIGKMDSKYEPRNKTRTLVDQWT